MFKKRKNYNEINKIIKELVLSDLNKISENSAKNMNCIEYEFNSGLISIKYSISYVMQAKNIYIPVNIFNCAKVYYNNKLVYQSEDDILIKEDNTNKEWELELYKIYKNYINNSNKKVLK